MSIVIKSERSLIGTGMIAAIAGSICCITPVLALLAGTTGLAATFSWIEPIRPYLIAITGLTLGTAWYLKLKPQKANTADCNCEVEPKKKFIESKAFLGVVTVFAIATLTLPSYVHIFYSSENNSVLSTKAEKERAVLFEVDGMTCSGCTHHIEHVVQQVLGVSYVESSYKEGTTYVEFDEMVASFDAIKKAINSTGYTVITHTEK